MNKWQHSVKTFALAFAAMLTVVIIGVIILGVDLIASWLPSSYDEALSNGINYSNTFDKDEITEITINNDFGRLIIKHGETFEVTGENVLESFSCNIKEGTLAIAHTSRQNLNLAHHSRTNITITIPKDAGLQALDISTGIDSCTIDDIEASEFVLKAGVGEVTISNLTSDNVNIEGGVGNININNSCFGDFALECGIGAASISGRLNNCTISSGIGEVKLEIDGNFEDYDIDMSIGIGAMYIDGKHYQDDTRLNKGAKNKLKIEGGMGNISVTFN